MHSHNLSSYNMLPSAVTELILIRLASLNPVIALPLTAGCPGHSQVVLFIYGYLAMWEYQLTRMLLYHFADQWTVPWRIDSVLNVTCEWQWKKMGKKKNIEVPSYFEKELPSREGCHEPMWCLLKKNRKDAWLSQIIHTSDLPCEHTVELFLCRFKWNWNMCVYIYVSNIYSILCVCICVFPYGTIMCITLIFVMGVWLGNE